jgi:hypothetical protein
MVDLILWPGTKVCERLGIDPKGDAGLIRSMFNMLFYLSLFLTIMLGIMA